MKRQWPPWLWTIICLSCILLMGLVDWKTGYELNFFVFYFVPIVLGAWFVGLGAAVAFAVLSALVWGGADVLTAHIYSSGIFLIWNTVIRLAAFLSIGWSVFAVRQAMLRERQTTEALRKALSEVRVLEAFLPICSQCKKIRDKDGSWQRIESYIGEHTATQFSHGYCPECARQVMAAAGLDEK